MKTKITIAIVLIFALAIGWQSIAAQTATPATPSIKIVEPANGATIGGPRLIVTVSKANFTFDPAATNNPAAAGRGNFRVFLDDQFAGMDFGAVTALPNDTMPFIKSGAHRLAVRLYNRDNTPYAGAQNDEISVTFANDMSYHAADGNPAIEIVGQPQLDKYGHFVIQARITGYKMSPQRINLAPEPGLGHYHVYVDDGKLANVGVSEISSIPSDFNPDPNLLTPGQHTVKLVLETHQHVPIAGATSPVVTFTVKSGDLIARDSSLPNAPATSMDNMPGMQTAAPTFATLTSASPTSTTVATATSAIPTPTPSVTGLPQDGNPGFGLWLLAIVGLGSLFVLAQAVRRDRQQADSKADKRTTLRRGNRLVTMGVVCGGRA